nr:hypothetical protein [Tanacetum cinerariifolium]
MDACEQNCTELQSAVEAIYSPEGPVMVVPNLPGVPKFGVP